jgi:NADPH:quinone reductase-like Zn-dependent oxidoreductase
LTIRKWVQNMKAVVYKNYGGAEVLEIAESPQPEAGDDEILLRVRAAGVNRLDVTAQAGKFRVKPNLPHIGGSEVAGEIVTVGENVAGWSPGQRVVVAPYLPDADNFDENVARLHGKILGVGTPGGWAEYVTAPANSLVAIPEELEFEEAAAQILGGVSAWQALVGKSGVHPGQWVLIEVDGGTSYGLAIQIAKMWGAQVIAASPDAELLAKAALAGADETVNSANPVEAFQRIGELTSWRGVDIIFDTAGRVGGLGWQSLAPDGHFVVTDSYTDATVGLNLTELVTHQIMLIGSYGGSRQDLAEVLRFSAESRLEAVIDSVYALDEIGAAQTRLANGASWGSLIIKF